MFYLGITSFPAAMPGKEKYLHKLKSLGEQKKRERETGNFYLQLLHSSLCWRWEKEEEREMKRGSEPESCFKIENSSDNTLTNTHACTHTHTHTHTQRPISL